MSRQRCGSRARAEVRELQGVQVSTRSHSRCSRTCRADLTTFIMECHDRADSDTCRGRDECLRVNTARTGVHAELKGSKLMTVQVSHAARTAHLRQNTTSSENTVYHEMTESATPRTMQNEL